MQTAQAPIKPPASPTQIIPSTPLNLPDHKQLPDSDGTFVKNFQEHPQSIVLTSSIEPVLQKLHPDGRYCIGQDSGIYWRLIEPPEKGAEAPDWFYVPNVSPLLDGEYRRSYVLWKEKIVPLIAIEFVSGNGDEERDDTPPPKVGKFWVYEQAIKIPFYAIYEVRKASVDVYQLINGRYARILPNQRGHYAIAPMGVELGIQEKGSIPWLRWWDRDGNLLLTAEERVIVVEAIAEQERNEKLQERIAKQEAEAIADQERLIALQERNKNEKLAAYLRSLGLDPDEI
jgi:Uma2 family endonuclease